MCLCVLWARVAVRVECACACSSCDRLAATVRAPPKPSDSIGLSASDGERIAYGSSARKRNTSRLLVLELVLGLEAQHIAPAKDEQSYYS